MMMMMMMRRQSVFVLSVVTLLLLCVRSSVFKVVAVDGASVSEECSEDFQKVMACLNYATGKESTPSKDCCSSVKDIKDSDPKCLCYIMQQAHNGSAQAKSLGIQEAKLFQLPSACQMQNASVSFCPKLLGISPSSPDAAIFSNSSTPATPSSSTTPSTGTSASEKTDNSNGDKHKPGVVAMAILLCTFAAGFASPFYI